MAMRGGYSHIYQINGRPGQRKELNSFVTLSWKIKVNTMTYNGPVYSLINAIDEAEEKSPFNKGDEEELPEVMVDMLGHPILPIHPITNLRAQQDVVREIFTKAYSKLNLCCVTLIF